MLEILINDEPLEVQAKPEHLSLYSGKYNYWCI